MFSFCQIYFPSANEGVTTNWLLSAARVNMITHLDPLYPSNKICLYRSSSPCRVPAVPPHLPCLSAEVDSINPIARAKTCFYYTKHAPAYAKCGSKSYLVMRQFMPRLLQLLAALIPCPLPVLFHYFNMFQCSGMNSIIYNIIKICFDIDLTLP